MKIYVVCFQSSKDTESIEVIAVAFRRNWVKKAILEIGNDE